MSMGVVLKFKVKNIIGHIMILDSICDFHRRIDFVVFISAAFDFSNERSIIFNRNHRLRSNFSILFENVVSSCREFEDLILFLKYSTEYN